MQQRTIPIVALFLALLFGVRFTSITGSSAESSKSSGGQAGTSSLTETLAAEVSPAERQGAVCETVNQSACNGKSSSGFCSPVWKQTRSGEALQAWFGQCHEPAVVPVIATLADPNGTRLGLAFDRQLDSIQSAAAERGFYPTWHFLPWSAAPASNAAKDNGPGLLVLRKEAADGTTVPPADGSAYLLVLLVPESPVAGIDTATFRHSEEIVAALAPAGDKVIHLMGPRFSGSATSLNALEAELSPTGKCIQAISGSITNSRPFARDQQLCAGQRRYRTNQASDEEALYLLKQALLANGYFESELAIVSEDETEYGAQTFGRVIHFPREISRLRNAYAPMLGSGGGKKDNGAQPVLKIELADSHAEAVKPGATDTVPPFGSPHSTLAQDSVLLEIADTLNTEHVRAVGIVATDPLDTLFLLQFLRTASPDIRLVVLDPDLLYLRAADFAPTSGVLAINSFGLFPRNEWWLRAGDNHSRLFSSAYQMADHYAFAQILRELFPGRQPDAGDSARSLWPGGLVPPQVQSAAANTSSPIWLTAMGTSDYQPVAILNDPCRQRAGEEKESSTGEDNKNSITRENKDSTGKEKKSLSEVCAEAIGSLDPGRPPRFVAMAWGLIALIGILQLAGLMFPKITPLRLRPDFDLSDNKDEATVTRAMCHSIGLITAAFGQLIVGSAFLYFHATPGYAMAPFTMPTYRMLAWAVFSVTVILLLGAVFVYFRWLLPAVRNQGRDRYSPQVMAIITALFLLGFSAPMVVWWMYVFRFDYSSLAFHLRNLNLASGVAPVTPLVLLIVIPYCAVWVYLRRVTYAEYRRPELPAFKLDKVFPGDFSREAGAIDNCLFRSLEKQWGMGFAATFLLVLLAFMPWRALGSFEPRWFRGVMQEAFCLALLIILLNWFRLLNTWSLLHRILEGLDRGHLREVFSRMPREKSLPIWRWGIAANSYLPAPQAIEWVRSLQRSEKDVAVEENMRVFEYMVEQVMHSEGMPQRAEKARAAAAGGEITTTIASAGFAVANSRPESRTENKRKFLVCQLRQAMTGVLEAVLNRVLWPRYWGQGIRGQVDEKSGVPDAAAIAENLLAHRYYSYIRFVTSEMRNLIFFLVAAFTLLLFALKSYPFNGQNSINWMLVALFLILGAGVWRVLAQMERDPVLSRLHDSKPGELSWSFYLRIAGYGLVPLLSILAAQFPGMSRFLFGWLQPGLEAFR